MMRISRGIMLVVLCGLSATAAANAPAPPRPKAPPVTIDGKKIQAPVVIRKEKWKESDRELAVAAKLIVPRSMLLKGLAKQAETPNAAPNQQGGIGGLRTTLAGLALSLAAVGIVFAYRGGRTTKLVAATVILTAGGLGTWSVAQADIAIPGQPRGPRPPRPELISAPDAPRDPQIVIELSDGNGDEGNTVTLILPE